MDEHSNGKTVLSATSKQPSWEKAQLIARGLAYLAAGFSRELTAETIAVYRDVLGDLPAYSLSMERWKHAVSVLESWPYPGKLKAVLSRNTGGEVFHHNYRTLTAEEIREAELARGSPEMKKFFKVLHEMQGKFHMDKPKLKVLSNPKRKECDGVSPKN